MQGIVSGGARLESGPHRDGGRHIVPMQVVHHGSRVGPVGGVPLGDVVKVALPPIIVNNQYIQRDLLFTEGVQHILHFFLRAVPVAGLHIPKRIFGQHGRFSGYRAVTGNYGVGFRAIEKVIIHGIRGLAGVPVHLAAVQPVELSVGGDVEQDAVAHVGIKHGGAFFGVGLGDLDRLVFDAHGVVDVAEAIQGFVVVRHEFLRNLVAGLVVVQLDRFVRAVSLRQNDLSGGVVIGYLAGRLVDGDFQFGGGDGKNTVCFDHLIIRIVPVVFHRKGVEIFLLECTAGRIAHVDDIRVTDLYLH